ncbi:MAG: hypothetical protein MUQ10_08675 [Anaerolineae bacterium]|nr:hypothetical protein [Anaerolineae bacterium]
MESEALQHQTDIEMVLAPPDEVYAGMDVALQVKVWCPEMCALQGSLVRIIDAEDVVVLDVDLVSFDEEANATHEFIVRMPIVPGSYTWTALFLGHEGGEVHHEESSVAFTFTVQPHRIALSVWGVPLPATQGREFTAKVGAKCSAGCSLAGLLFVVRNAEGDQATTGLLGDDPLPQTSGLYWSEQTLVAPDQEGLTTWVVECLASELELPHQVTSGGFKLKVASPPDQTVTIEVIDKARKTPLKGASVFVHPYRSITDEQGLASLQVGAGSHELYVKLDDYTGFRTTIEVAGDVTVKAEMLYSPDPYA